jgi:hypothetical protein
VPPDDGAVVTPETCRGLAKYTKNKLCINLVFLYTKKLLLSKSLYLMFVTNCVKLTQNLFPEVFGFSVRQCSCTRAETHMAERQFLHVTRNMEKSIVVGYRIPRLLISKRTKNIADVVKQQ